MKRLLASLASASLLLLMVPATTQAVGPNGNFIRHNSGNARLVGNGARRAYNARLSWQFRKSPSLVSSIYMRDLSRYVSNPPALTVTGAKSNDESKSVERGSKRSIRANTYGVLN